MAFLFEDLKSVFFFFELNAVGLVVRFKYSREEQKKREIGGRR